MTHNNLFGDGLKMFWNRMSHNFKFNRGAAFGAMIICALLSFEIFNFSTTQYTLHDMLGDLSFAGLRWATILAVAFCGIDFAGIARIFTPETGADEPVEVWYLFGAWVLAAGFNAVLTWWGVAVAISKNPNLQSSAVVSAETMAKLVPIFIAFMVWLIRLLIIGSFSKAGDRLFSTEVKNAAQQQNAQKPSSQPRPSYAPAQTQANQPVFRAAAQINRPVNASNNSFRPAPKAAPTAQQSSFAPAEPTYHPVASERHYNA